MDVQAIRTELLARFPGTLLALDTDRAGDVFLDLIVVPAERRRQGWAGQIVGELAAAADQDGTTLRLTAAPLSLPIAELVRFYMRFGFRTTTGKSTDGVKMLRRPMVREPAGV